MTDVIENKISIDCSYIFESIFPVIYIGDIFRINIKTKFYYDDIWIYAWLFSIEISNNDFIKISPYYNDGRQLPDKIKYLFQDKLKQFAFEQKRIYDSSLTETVKEKKQRELGQLKMSPDVKKYLQLEKELNLL